MDTYYNPVKIVSKRGLIKGLAQFVKEEKVLLVTSAGFTRRGLSKEIQNVLSQKSVTLFDQINPNPDLDELDQISEAHRNQNFQAIIALGGGSVIDAAKALCLSLVQETQNPLDALFRKKEKLQGNVLPLYAIPTTAGTGSEITPFATIWDNQVQKKESLFGEEFYPKMALLDAELTITLPNFETLYTGLDATSHALESLWNRNKTLISESFSIRALELIQESFLKVLENPKDIDAREKMQLASTLAGVAISQTKTAVCHSISYPLTLKYDIPHGLACSFTLEEVLKVSDLKLPAHIDLAPLFSKLKISKEIERYCSLDQALSLLSEMFTKDRVKNFSLDIGEQDVRSILENSF